MLPCFYVSSMSNLISVTPLTCKSVLQDHTSWNWGEVIKASEVRDNIKGAIGI